MNGCLQTALSQPNACDTMKKDDRSFSYPGPNAMITVCTHLLVSGGREPCQLFTYGSPHLRGWSAGESCAPLSDCSIAVILVLFSLAVALAGVGIVRLFLVQRLG